MTLNSQSGIRDNYHRGNVGDFLKTKIQQGSNLSIVSAYFTIYAYAALKDKLVDYLSNSSKQKKGFELKTEINQLVYHLYGLTEEEIAVVEGKK